MSGSQLVADPGSLAWEARACWATGRLVALSLSDECVFPRVAGRITAVSPVDAFLRILPEGEMEDVHVPIRAVRAIHRPHFHEPGSWRPRSSSGGEQQVLEGQLGLVGELPVSPRAAGAMARAARSMLPGDVLATLAAVDRAGRRPDLGMIAESAGRSERWVARRLAVLERERYVRRVRRHRRRDVFLLG